MRPNFYGFYASQRLAIVTVGRQLTTMSYREPQYGEPLYNGGGLYASQMHSKMPLFKSLDPKGLRMILVQRMINSNAFTDTKDLFPSRANNDALPMRQLDIQIPSFWTSVSQNCRDE